MEKNIITSTLSILSGAISKVRTLDKWFSLSRCQQGVKRYCIFIFGETLLWQKLQLNCLLCVLDSSKSISLNVGLFVRSTSVVEKTKNTKNKESEIWMQRKGSTHGLGFHETKGCSERKLGGNEQKLKIYMASIVYSSAVGIFHFIRCPAIPFSYWGLSDFACKTWKISPLRTNQSCRFP